METKSEFLEASVEVFLRIVTLSPFSVSQITHVYLQGRRKHIIIAPARTRGARNNMHKQMKPHPHVACGCGLRDDYWSRARGTCGTGSGAPDLPVHM